MLNHRRIDARRLLAGLGLATALAIGAVPAFAQSAPTPASAVSSQDIQRLVVEEASKTLLPPSLALAVARVESNFIATAQSSRGARGVMQILPDLAKDSYSAAPDDLFEPKTNIHIGVDYLQRLSHRYGGRWDLVLTHYFYGIGVDQPAPPMTWEVRRYVDSVLGWQRYYEREEAIAKLQRRVARIAQGPSVPAAGYDRREPPPYWTIDDSPGARDWRSYLRIADYWLARRAADSRAGSLAPERSRPAREMAPERFRAAPPATTPVGDEEGYLPSQRLRSNTDEARQRFRRYLESGDRPWEYVSGAYRSDFDR
jgi:hypothetical protein